MSQEELRDLLKERTQKEKQIYIANVTGIGELFFFLVDEMADITFSRYDGFFLLSSCGRL